MDYGMIDSCVTLVLLFSVGAHNLHKRSKHDEIIQSFSSDQQLVSLLKSFVFRLTFINLRASSEYLLHS